MHRTIDFSFDARRHLTSVVETKGTARNVPVSTQVRGVQDWNDRVVRTIPLGEIFAELRSHVSFTGS